LKTDTGADTAESAHETFAARLLSSACAIGACGALFAAQQLNALPWNGQFTATMPTLIVLGGIAVVTAVAPWLAVERRSTWVLWGSLAVGAIVTRALIVVPLGFAWLTSRVSRTSWPVWQKLAVLLGTWTLVIAARGVAPHCILFPYRMLFLYWACLPAAVICLVVERARGQLDQLQQKDDLSYLLALPRFFLPFLQPIGAGRLINSRSAYSPQLALRALGLGLWGVACLLALKYTHYSLRGGGESFDFLRMVQRVVNNGVLIYGVNASGIFCGVALFRLLGYDLGSGFRFPLLASSFSDLYRRWNYYFYEFVSSIFYLPLVTWLRRRLPLPLAYMMAGYPSVLLGVWALDNFTFQLAVDGFGLVVLRQLTDWQDLVAHAGVWSLIILPQVALSRFRQLRRHRWWRVGAHTLTLATCFVLLAALSWLDISLY
jgi:hypothetical protein